MNWLILQVSINLDSNGNCQRCDVESLNQWNKSSDFPVINPAFSGSKNTYLYAAATSGSRSSLPHFPFDMVVKLNAASKSVLTWSVGSRRFIGEPIFIPKGYEEDDGYIVVVEVHIHLYSVYKIFKLANLNLKVRLSIYILLVLQYAVSVQRCYLVILDSKKIGGADALVARLEVPKHLNFPLGFHGFWATAA